MQACPQHVIESRLRIAAEVENPDAPFFASELPPAITRNTRDNPDLGIHMAGTKRFLPPMYTFHPWR